MIKHRSSSPFPALRFERDKILPQFRFIIRQALACHQSGVSFDLDWQIPARKVTLTIEAASIPAARPFPKEPRLKLVSSWSPKSWEAEYRTEAFHSSTLRRLTPAFVISHSSGLSLMMQTDTGEWGSEHGDADPAGKWCLAHTASGRGFGLDLPLTKACEALLFAASQPDVDWTRNADDLTGDVAFMRAGLRTQIAFGRKADRSQREQRLDAIAA